MKHQRVKALFMLDVSEIFGPTVQGEGKRVGRPSIFIRLARCNLSCSGFAVQYVDDKGQKKLGCDTYYAVDPCFKSQWKKQTSTDIIEQVTALCGDNKYDIVISGGEPLLFWKKADFQALLAHFYKQKQQVTIETNASITIQFTENYQQHVLFSMSVKLANANEPVQKRINPQAIKNIVDNSTDCYFKFVVNKQEAQSCLTEIKQITGAAAHIDVYLMPQGDTVQALANNDQAVVDLCTKHNYIYCDRTHVRIWSDKRGV